MIVNNNYLIIFIILFLAGCGPTPEGPGPDPTPTAHPASDSIQTKVQPPKPTPKISSDWADLPELPTAEPILPSTGASPPLPTVDPTDIPDPATDGFTLPIPNALWSAGVLNGSPTGLEGEEISSTEYDTSGRTDPVLHISSPAELPPFLEASQQLVIHLPGISGGSYRVNVATTGGGPETLKEEYLDKETFADRNLTIRWNDHLIWQRWLPPVFFLTRAAVPPTTLSSESNLLLLENSGTQPLPLDALWVDAVPTEGNPFYVSLEDAQWLNRDDSKWVKSTTLALPLPTVEASWTPPSDLPVLHPPRTPAELPNAWQNTLHSYRLLEADAPELAQAFRPWMQKAAQAVSRGMMPSIQVSIDRKQLDSNTFQTAVFLFAPFFHTWLLPGEPASTEHLDVLRKLSPNATLVSTSGSRADLKAHTVVRYPKSFNGLLAEHAAKYRRFFDGDVDRDELDASLAEPVTLKALFRGYNWPKQAYHSDEFFSGAGDLLMVKDQPLFVHGGFPGSPFFPAGDDTPGMMWHYLKPLFRFGGPGHHKGIANLTPDSPGSGIGRTSWAVADNGTDSVQVLVRNHIGLNDRLVKLELPVPWTGPTRVLHHSVRSSWSTTKAPEAKLDHRVVEANGTGPTGWITIPFGLQGIQMFELHPKGADRSRRIEAPERVGFSELREVEDLFTVDRYAPPPWWSRMPMGAHFFAYWRYSGNVDLSVDVDATRDRAPGWAPFKAIHYAVWEEVEAVSPLRDTSTRFRFGEPIENVAQVMRAGYNRTSAYKGEIMGMWLRVNPPPGFKPKFDPFHAVPRTKFYMGKLPYRQLIELDYGRWYFITSKADIWRRSVSKYNPYLMFWPANPEDGNPEIEINSFEMYQVKLEDTKVTPEKCMGFVQEDGNGNLQVLVLGIPGKPAFWRQRLPNLVDVTRLTHTVDRELLTTADTPEADPPERVRHRVRLLEDSKILEIEIEKMPAPPSPSHLKKIEKAYPLLRDVVSEKKLGVFLMEMKEPEE